MAVSGVPNLVASLGHYSEKEKQSRSEDGASLSTSPFSARPLLRFDFDRLEELFIHCKSHDRRRSKLGIAAVKSDNDMDQE